MSNRLQQALVRRSVGPFAFFGVALALASLLACLGVVVFLATSSPRDLWSARMFGRTYNAAPIGQVFAQLEQDRIIPRGTRIEPALKDQPVTGRVAVFATDFQALDQIASAARLCIAVPVGQHGELEGPVTVRASGPRCRPGAWTYHYRLPVPNTLPPN